MVDHAMAGHGQLVKLTGKSVAFLVLSFHKYQQQQTNVLITTVIALTT
jgi:hypothetical protein